jgi:hypothetical protein
LEREIVIKEDEKRAEGVDQEGEKERVAKGKEEK